MGHDTKVNGLTPQIAATINDKFGAENAKDLKKAVKEELTQALQNGQISKQEMKAALKYLDNELANALVRRNNVERTAYETVYGFDDLSDKKADKLMKESGLTINDLYAASQFAGADYEVSYTKLSKQEREKAENGEITASELKNIQNALNKKIRDNGGTKFLDEKETKTLMKGLGLSIESKFNIGKIIISATSGLLGGGLLGGIGKAKATASASATTIAGGAAATATSTVTAAASNLATGVVGGMLGGMVGTAAELIHQTNRKEKPFGEQGGAEGGQGSVTNKTEAKMHEVGTLGANAQPLPPVEKDPIKEFLEE